MKADGQEFRHIELSIDGGIAIITFNRPEVRNAINDAMRVEFATVLDRLSNDDAARAVVLTGKGAGFCSGGDIAGMKERLAAPAGEIAFTGWQRQKRLHQAIAILRGMGKPTVAAVNGAAAGLGCDLALACDFIIASEAASFAMSFILRGLVPDFHWPAGAGAGSARHRVDRPPDVAGTVARGRLRMGEAIERRVQRGNGAEQGDLEQDLRT
jgi:enoyl-CoA hydratase/carnithine racemase